MFKSIYFETGMENVLKEKKGLTIATECLIKYIFLSKFGHLLELKGNI